MLFVHRAGLGIVHSGGLCVPELFWNAPKFARRQQSQIHTAGLLGQFSGGGILVNIVVFSKRSRHLCLIVSQSHELSAIETSATHLRKTRLSVEVSKLHILWFQFMQKRGNSEAKAIFEKCVPAFFYKPQQKDCL